MNKWELFKIQVLMLGNLQNIAKRVHTYIVHRRGGKSRGITKIFRYKIGQFLQEREIYKLRGSVDSRNPNMSFLAPTKRQARDIIWDYFKDYFGNIAGAKPNEAQLTFTIPRPFTGDRIKIHLYASKFHDRMRGTEQRAIAVDEFQDSPADALDTSIMPTMDAVGRDNADLFVTGTVKGKDHLHEWCLKQLELENNIAMMPVYRSGVFTDEEIKALKREYAKDVFDREYGCDFNAPLEGTFFNAKLQILMNGPNFYTAVRAPNLPLIASFDLGVDQALSVWVFQAPGPNEIHMLDYYEDYDDLGKLAMDMAEEGNTPDCIFVPHDATHRQLSAGRAVRKVDVVKAAFPESKVYKPLVRATSIEVAIQNTSNHLHLLRFPMKGQPTDAHVGLSHLMAYGRKRDKATGLFQNKIDKSRGVDHAADSLRTCIEGLLCKMGTVRRFPTYRIMDKVAIHPHQYYSSPMLQRRGNLLDTWRDTHGTYGQNYDARII